MTHAIPTFSLRLPRHCVSPRQVARAGDIWRLFQEAAVRASMDVGWSGQRFIDEGVGFIVSRMTVIHHRELAYGEPVDGRTWIRDWRRSTLSRREVRLSVAEEAIADATQQWVHVALNADSGGMTPTRASETLLASFPALEVDAPMVRLPEVVSPVRSAPHVFSFDVWHTWMDPFAHVNHPVYVDWADEAIARQMIAAGLDPQRIVPVADQVRFKRGLTGGTSVTVETQIQGLTSSGDVVLRHRVDTVDGQTAADVITVRRLHGERQPDWLAVFA
jgi:acyl-CoA thioesterase FadM